MKNEVIQRSFEMVGQVGALSCKDVLLAEGDCAVGAQPEMHVVRCWMAIVIYYGNEKMTAFAIGDFAGFSMCYCEQIGC